jgi:uncharacterized protein
MVSRRTVLKTVAGSCAMALVPTEAAIAAVDTPPPAKRFRPWDQHSHLGSVPGNTPEERMAYLVKCMDRVGVERLLLSQGYSTERNPNPPEVFIQENDRVMAAVKAFPDRAFGALFITPRLPEFSLQEMERCIVNGPMVTIGEIEADARCNVPGMDPIAERAVELEIPILQHEWLKTQGNEPNESSPFDVVELAKRHPKLQIVCAHSGGSFEAEIREIRSTKNVYAGVAGADPTAGFVEMAVRELGAERIIYGSDVGGRSFSSQLSKVLDADIKDSEKELILGGNMRRLLSPILKRKGYKI